MVSGFLLAALLACMLPVVAVAAAQETAPFVGGRSQIEVEMHDGLLTLRAVNAPLGEVIGEIGAKAGFETTIHGDLDASVHRSFDSVPLERALRKLLSGVSNIMHFDKTAERKVTGIVLFATAGPVSVPIEAVAEPSETSVVDRSLDAERAEAVSRAADRGRAGDAEAVTEVANLLRSDPDPAVRGAAAAALGDIGSAEAAEILQSGVRDDDRTVRIRSIRALALIGNDQSTQILADVLFNHADTRTRLLAAWALGQQGSPLAQSYLETARNDGDELVREAVDRARAGETAVEP